MALIHNSDPVLHPEVAFRAGQCIALQIDAQRVKGLVYPNPELTSACLKESAEPKQNLRGECDNADRMTHRIDLMLQDCRTGRLEVHHQRQHVHILHTSQEDG